MQGDVERSARQKPEILMTAITDGKIKKQLLGKISQIKTKLKKIYKVDYGTSACPFIAFFYFYFKALVQHQPINWKNGLIE